VTKAVTDVLLWAQRVANRIKPKPFELLEIKPDCTLEQVQEAYYKIARLAHPDLHRTTLNPEELERVTLAYTRITAAYQTMRTQKLKSARLRKISPNESGKFADFNAEPPTPPPVVPPPPVAVDPFPPRAVTPATTQMSSKALVYYRKAEMSLRRGDLKTAILHLKMSIAADPQSQFLRAALAEVEFEIGKKT
jgi:curved DNA-binding protein CbpA